MKKILNALDKHVKNSMVNSLKTFINSFRKRDGVSVLFSTFLVKFIAIVSSILIVRILSKEEYGAVSFAISLTSILIAFEGLGTTYSLLRFGAQLKSHTKKFNLYRYSLEKGLLYSIIVVIALISIVIIFIPDNLTSATGYIIILAFSIFTGFCLNLSLSYFRIIGKNKIYSFMNAVGSLISASLIIGLAFFFQAYGYAVALTLAPLLTFLFFHKHLLRKSGPNSDIKKLQNHYTFSDKEFFAYGLHTGVGTVANQVTIMAGPIIAGFMNTTTTDLALFRVATIIPFNLLIIPALIMTTDFVHLSKNANNAKVLKEYFIQYAKSITIIFTVPFLALLFFNQEILTMLYSNSYKDAAHMSFVLIISVYFSFLLRVPLGNILSAVGKADWNVYHAIAWFILFIPFSIISYNIWGIVGISYSIAIVLALSGFISLYLFIRYLKIIDR